jgi:hypothetical protein
MRITSHRGARLALIGVMLGALPLTGCEGDDEGDGTDVKLSVSAISNDTFVPFFSMGHDLEYLPYGGIGVLRTGATWTASIDFIDVPEGKYVPRYDGYGLITMNITGVGAVQAYCELEWGLDIDQLAVTSGGRNEAEIEMSSITGCENVGFDRFITNPNYEFDPNHKWAGSTDGENFITIYIDDLEPMSDVDFRVCDEDVGQDCDVSPFGIFPDLPDPPDSPSLARPRGLGGRGDADHDREPRRPRGGPRGQAGRDADVLGGELGRRGGPRGARVVPRVEHEHDHDHGELSAPADGEAHVEALARGSHARGRLRRGAHG